MKPKNKQVAIIAGPCSIDKNNLKEILQISKIKIDGKRAVWGTRIVGLKSRTSLDESGKGMGFDFPTFSANLFDLSKYLEINHLDVLTTAQLAKKIIEKTGLVVATEIMSPWLQLPIFERVIPKGYFLAWNPAVMQLGWPILEMSTIAKKNDWYIGVKNGKWIGDGGEKTWQGLSSYSQTEKTVMIHRGFDVDGKGDYRNKPDHEIVKRVKQITGRKMFFDPSHICGHKLKNAIVQQTLDAINMKDLDGDYLYEGILIEVGSSQTDTDQHISVKELRSLLKGISRTRAFYQPGDIL